MSKRNRVTIGKGGVGCLTKKAEFSRKILHKIKYKIPLSKREQRFVEKYSKEAA